MSQVVQYDKNPSAEGAAARVSRVGATPSLATDTFTGWPLLGTKSHKLVATATTIATVGLPNAERPAAAVGQVWSASVPVRNSAAASRSIVVSIVFYDTAGATLGTALATASSTATLTAGQVQTFTVTSAAAPASTASVDLQVTRAAGGGAAVSDPVHFDMVSLTRTPAPVAYADPSSTVLATWTGTAHASTQVYWTPVLTLTTAVDASPAPRILVFADDLPPGVTSLTLFRLAEGRTFKVRGAVGVAVAGAFSIPDIEAPFNVAASYRAQLFAGSTSVGFTATVAATLLCDDCWVHNPLAPTGATVIDIVSNSGNALSRTTAGERFYPEQRTLAVFVTGRRQGLQDVQLYFSTADPAVATKFEAMFGGYGDDDQMVPVLCVRTPAYFDVPRTFFAGMLKLTKKPINVHMGGNLREWEGSADEAAPPFAGIVVALLKRSDIDFFFATRNLLDAAYATRTAIDRDYSKAGTT